MKTYLIPIGVLILCAVGIWVLQKNNPSDPVGVQETSQAETANATESKPAAPKPQPTKQPAATTPTTPTATTPIQPPAPKATYVNTNEEDIFIVLPRPGDTVDANITISGAARGNWFQQGMFIAEVIASNGDVLVQNNIPAEGNYMTTALVQFSSSVFISSNYHGAATLILRNDNPQGHPIPDRSVSIPIVIK